MSFTVRNPSDTGAAIEAAPNGGWGSRSIDVRKTKPAGVNRRASFVDRVAQLWQSRL
jgi:hypothetical protein